MPSKYFSAGSDLGNRLKQIASQRGFLFTVIILAALLSFESFNYSTTDYALADLLGPLRFVGIRWSTILAIAFCGIDFAGIARLFTPETGANEPTEVWYLFGAWMLAAVMNAILTWWGVSMALVNHQLSSTAVMDPATLLKVVPIFVAVMVWLIRILIIGTLSVAGDRMFNQAVQARGQANSYTQSPAVTMRSSSAHSGAASYSGAQQTTSAHASAVQSSPAGAASFAPAGGRPASTFQPVYRPANRTQAPNTLRASPASTAPARMEPGYSAPAESPSRDEPSAGGARPEPVYTSLSSRAQPAANTRTF